MTNTPNSNTPTNNARRHGPSAVVLAFFTSPLFMMFALGLALLAQGKHTADVFAYWSHHNTPEWLFYAFAAGVEIAVFIFVLHDRKLISYAFAVGAFATNVVYYAIGGANLLSAEIVPVFLLSLLLPGVIVGYSHTIAEKPTQDDTQGVAQTTRRAWWRWLVFWRKPAETPTTSNTARENVPAPVAHPEVTTAHPSATSDTAAQTDATPKQPQMDAKPAKLTPAQRQDIIIARGYKTTAEVMQAFGIKERSANGDLAEVRKSLLQTNGTGVH